MKWIIWNNSEFFSQISEFSANFWFVFANLIEKATHVTIFWNLARNPEKNSSKIRRKKCKIRIFCDWISEYSLIQSQKKLAIFDEKIEIRERIPRERCKGVHCVDLGESFPTSIYLQKSASIQPRTSPSKFGEKFNSLFTSLLRRDGVNTILTHFNPSLSIDYSAILAQSERNFEEQEKLRAAMASASGQVTSFLRHS